MKNILLAGAALMLTAGIPSLTGSLAQASPLLDSFCGPSSGQGCEAGGEQMVFFQKQMNTMLGFGNVGGPSNLLPTMDIHSDGGMLDVNIDLANGFATIKPHNGISFNGLDITIPGFDFTELVFDDQLTPTANPTDNFTIDAFSGAHVDDGLGTETEAADTDKEYSVTAKAGTFFDEVNIKSLTGFDEIKHIEVGGLCTITASGTCAPFVFPVTEPAPLLVLAVGLLTLGMVRYRRQ